MLPEDYLTQFIADLGDSAPVPEDFFARDISCPNGQVDPGFGMVGGDEMLVQLLYRMITTAPYSMYGDPDFCFDIQQTIHSQLTGIEVGARITAKVKQHPYFSDCQTEVTRIAKGYHYKIVATAVGRGPVVVETAIG